MPGPEPDVWVRFRPLKSDVPAAQRLRRLLKLAGRQLRLKCVEVRELPPPAVAVVKENGP